MPIKTTMRYYLTPVGRLPSVTQQVLTRRCRKGNSWALWVEMHTGAGTVKSNLKLPHNIKNGNAL